MQIAVVGSSGYIAGFFIKKLAQENICTRILRIGHSKTADRQLDLKNAKIFDYDILCGIDYVIFTAAISGPDKCATDFDECWSINVTGTIYFIQEALKRKCKVLFFSSDAVFGDKRREVYDEFSCLDATTPYGRMKKEVEIHFKKEKGFKAVRLSYVASAKDKFISYCLGCMKDGQVADVFHPFYRNVITVSDVVIAVLWMIKHWDGFSNQILCLAGRELVSRVRIADELNQIYDNRLHYTISKPKESFYQNRPCITQMRSRFLYKNNILEEKSFSEKLKEQMEEIVL